MRNAHRSATLGGVLLILTATACGVSPDDTYSGAEDLRDSLDSEGFRCTGGDVSTFDSGYAETLTCDEGIEVAVWEDDYPDYVDGPSLIAMGSALFDSGQHLLTTDTWLIRSSNASLIGEIAPVFGGTYNGRNMELLCEYNPTSPRAVEDC